jgi:hypothetical protein
MSHAHESSVELRSFAVWVLGLGWRVPPQFAELAKVGSQESQGAGKPDVRWSTTTQLWTVLDTAHLFSDVEPASNADPNKLTGTVAFWYRDIKNAVTLGHIVPVGARLPGIGSSLLKPVDAVTWALDNARQIPEQFASIAPEQPSRAELNARIAELETQVGALGSSASRSAQTQRVRTLQRLVLGMAKGRYEWMPGARNTATGEKDGSIAADVAEHLGEKRRLGADAIRDALNEAEREFPGKQD